MKVLEQSRGIVRSLASGCLGSIFCISLLTTNPDLNAKIEALPAEQYAFLETYCLDCHDDFERKGDISFESTEIDWSESESLVLWERAIEALRKGEMPPEKKRQPSSAERAQMIDWLDGILIEKSPIGGTVLRRLNQREYVNSLNELLDIEYTLPNGFPVDNQAHGFDNQGDALTLSGPLMHAYSNVAADLAEKLFPPARKPVDPERSVLLGSEFTYSYSSGLQVGDVMRVVASTDALAHSATWPSRFEAAATGLYEVNLQLAAFNPRPSESIIASVHAVNAVEAPGERTTTTRLLKEIEIDERSPQSRAFEALLEKGETLAIHYSNATISEDRAKLRAHVKDLFIREPVLASAYMQADAVVERGRIGWERLKRLMKSELLPEPPIDDALDALVDRVVKNPRLTTEVLHYKHFEEGPALEVHGASVFGPVQLLDGEEERYWNGRVSRLLGDRAGRSDREVGAEFLEKFLPLAFRRPVPDDIVEEYIDMFEDALESSGRLEEGLHLAFRTALTSPYFLYRGFEFGTMDAYDLASRLSFFLTALPPDEKLYQSAHDGSLLDSVVLRKQAERLLESKRSSAFVGSFLDQWLDLAALEDLTPDKTLFPRPREFKYGDAEKQSIIAEPNLFFAEMLEANRPIVDFIDPGFTYTNYSIGTHVYELPLPKKGGGNVERVEFEKGGRFGGIMSMAGVMMATANGVDTQPVVRGVWMLENILGNPPPEPPDSVPALTPDTSKAESPREMLAAHVSEESCAACHKRIDPIGFVFESFDPIGRWRTHYPDLSGSAKDRTKNGLVVESGGVLPDGTVLNDVRDLKAYLLEDISPFAECLSEKLLTYATGRSMNYSDRTLIAELVAENIESGEGFRDLLLDLVDSESFRTK